MSAQASVRGSDVSQYGRFGKVVGRGADRGSMIFTGRPWHPREIDPDALQHVIDVKEGCGRRVAAAGSREDAHIGSVDVLAITLCEAGRKILCRVTWREDTVERGRSLARHAGEVAGCDGIGGVERIER